MDQALAAWRQHLALKQLLADIRLDLTRLEYLRKAGFNPQQPRDELGRWIGDGGDASESTGESIDLSGARRRAPLRLLHSDATYQSDPDARRSLDYWRRQPTDRLVESLKPGSEEPLVVYPDGRIANGNTRVKVLQERGYDINSLPRVPRQSMPSGRGGGPRGGGGSFGGGLPPRLLPPRF